jgi:hypothetical protein
MMNNLRLSTKISDSLLQQIRDYLDENADVSYGGSDPAQDAEPNAAMQLLTALDNETGKEFAQ